MKIESDRSASIDEREQMVPATAPLDEAVAQSVPSEPAVAQVASVQAETVHTVRTTWFTPSAVVAGIVAIGLLVLGGITVARAGLDGSLDAPVVTVAGFTATAVLGLIELGFGVVLLIAALARQLPAILFFGIIGGVAALIAVFEPTVGEDWLAIERGFAVWAAIAMGAIVASALLPTIRRINTRRTTDVT